MITLTEHQVRVAGIHDSVNLCVVGSKAYRTELGLIMTATNADTYGPNTVIKWSGAGLERIEDAMESLLKEAYGDKLVVRRELRGFVLPNKAVIMFETADTADTIRFMGKDGAPSRKLLLVGSAPTRFAV